jgi:hypothetical protein
MKSDLAFQSAPPVGGALREKGDNGWRSVCVRLAALLAAAQAKYFRNNSLC